MPSVGSGFHDGTILCLCSALGAFVYDDFTVSLYDSGCLLWSNSDISNMLEVPPLLSKIYQTSLSSLFLSFPAAFNFR